MHKYRPYVHDTVHTYDVHKQTCQLIDVLHGSLLSCFHQIPARRLYDCRFFLLYPHGHIHVLTPLFAFSLFYFYLLSGVLIQTLESNIYPTLFRVQLADPQHHTRGYNLSDVSSQPPIYVINVGPTTRNAI